MDADRDGVEFKHTPKKDLQKFLDDEVIQKLAGQALQSGTMQRVFDKRHRMYRMRYKATLYALLRLKAGDVVELVEKKNFARVPTRVRVQRVEHGANMEPIIRIGPIIVAGNHGSGINRNTALLDIECTTFIPLFRWQDNPSAENVVEKDVYFKSERQPGIFWKTNMIVVRHMFYPTTEAMGTMHDPQEITRANRNFLWTIEHLFKANTTARLQHFQMEHLVRAFKVYCALYAMGSFSHDLLDMILEQVCPEFHFYWRCVPR